MPGGNKKGGGLKSSPVYKMKGFSGFGNSPVKQTKAEHAKWAKEFDAWTDKKFTYSKTRGNMPGPKIKNIPKLDMTLNDNLNKAVKGKGPGSPKTLAAKEFLRRNTIKTPKAKTLGKSIRKVGKFLGGRFLGVGSLMMGTMGTADAGPYNKKFSDANKAEKFAIKSFNEAKKAKKRGKTPYKN